MHYDSVNAAFYYTDSIKKLIHRMKFDDGCELCEFMADMMYQRYKTLNSSFDMICYVPQTEAELQERGFNQSKLLAELLSIKCRLPVVPALTKIYETEHQRSLRALERSGNVFGVFDIADREAIKDKSILLVDDIKTGGATLNECAKMLKIYDAGTVTALVFAVGITDN